MQYKNEGDRPNIDDQIATDRFVDWYANELGLYATLLERPDTVRKAQTQPAVDAIYSLGAINLILEHTTFDELPAKRKYDRANAKLRQQFHSVKPQQKRNYTLSLPYGYPTEGQAQKVGDALAAWFQRNEAQITQRTQWLSVEGCDALLGASAFPAPDGIGKIYWLYDLDEAPAEGEVLARLDKALYTKLPKLRAQVAESPAVRILLLENNEMARGHKTDYTKSIMDYMQRNPDQQCDEVWSILFVADEMDCILHWSSQLDLPDCRTPYYSEEKSLGELLEDRKTLWIRSHQE